jgi:hypothetical protein
VLRIHAYLPRKILTSDEIMITIFIFSIYCIRAKKQGKQYTKRILPPFVIPECNISFTNVLAYLSRYPDGTINYDDAAYILGTYDERIIKKHIKRGREIIKKTIIKSLTLITTFLGYTSIRKRKPGKDLFNYLEELTDEIHLGRIRMGIKALHKPEKKLYLHMVYWFKKSRNPIICTLNRVFINLHFYDTS